MSRLTTLGIIAAFIFATYTAGNVAAAPRRESPLLQNAPAEVNLSPASPAGQILTSAAMEQRVEQALTGDVNEGSRGSSPVSSAGQALTSIVNEGSPPEQHQPSRAEQVTQALVDAYPRRVEKAEYRNGDWAVLLRGNWYYYAGGRLLPEELVEKADDYSPIVFYSYQSELLPWERPNPEQAARFRERTNATPANQRQRSLFFFDALWRAHNREESYDRIKSLRFLGHPVMVHYGILEELSLVEERILAAAKTDPQVRSWINTINTTEGWIWRNIANSRARSYHSYGVAIDILPRSLGGKETYWLWASQRRQDWWNISYEGRYHPPDAVIKAFEAYGFIWGGKWTYFDTMHFEYRPEVFLLNKMGLSTLR